MEVNMKKIILILSVLLLGNHSVYSDQFYQGSTGDDFYTGSMASRQPSSALDFTSKLPQYQPKKKKEFFNSALTPEFVGGFDEYDTKAVTQYYMFPMLIEEGQSAVFVGKIQGSDETVTLKDEEFLNVTVKKQLPIISGVLTLYVKKKKVEELTFKGNLMYIKQYPEDLLPTRQICEAKDSKGETVNHYYYFDKEMLDGWLEKQSTNPLTKKAIVQGNMKHYALASMESPLVPVVVEEVLPVITRSQSVTQEAEDRWRFNEGLLAQHTDEELARITEFSLANNGLRTIPAVLGRMPNLRSLDIII